MKGTNVPRLEAAERGAVHFEGTPCKRCGSTLRYVGTGACRACSHAASLRHRRKYSLTLKAAKGAKP